MHVRGGAQGGGGGRELTDRLVDWFRQSGFKHITVGPSEIGSYAWGAMGFDFQDMESRRMGLSVENIRKAFEWGADDYPPLPDDDAEIKKMIGQYRRAATRAMAGLLSYKGLSQVGRKKGQGKDDWWAGKLGLYVGGVGGGKITF